MSDHATTDTREIIVEILLSLEKGQDFSHKLMKAVLDKYDYLDPREKAFIKRVTEGTIERQLLPGTDETDGFYYARLRRKA